MAEIHGKCAAGFEGVRDAFAANFDRGLDVGASVAVTHNGEPVVDLWGGDCDANGTSWKEDTIVNVYSTTKTMAATCILMLADRGLVDLYAPVAKYWPEFAQNGKEHVLVAHVMGHTAGLSGFDEPTPKDLYDWNDIVGRLAAQAPWWEPGTKSGYHAVTQGFLQGEIVRRVTGKTIGNFFREEVAEPLGADFHIGLDPKHDARVADLIPPPNMKLGGGGLKKGSMVARTFAGPPLTGNEPKTREWRAAEIPAAGGIGNARSVARVHSALACGGTVDGVTLMSEAGVERALEEQSRGKDQVLNANFVFGMGFGLTDATFPISPNKRAFFWGGWGGSLAVIDLDARVSIAYVMNRMEPNLIGDPRGAGIVKAAFESLGA
ncbi:MAG TPA: class A beta-lactamase-related serine hydrolase [Myxococcales bacterium]|nr:class A beta-lactamase-related serine hydrolase [Myxococcales bacterium]HIM02996.1 class A beta-lactamase-related serine hydrolase [Myxococcales bacterium]